MNPDLKENKKNGFFWRRGEGRVSPNLIFLAGGGGGDGGGGLE